VERWYLFELCEDCGNTRASQKIKNWKGFKRPLRNGTFLLAVPLNNYASESSSQQRVIPRTLLVLKWEDTLDWMIVPLILSHPNLPLLEGKLKGSALVTDTT